MFALQVKVWQICVGLIPALVYWWNYYIDAVLVKNISQVGLLKDFEGKVLTIKGGVDHGVNHLASSLDFQWSG